MSTEQYMERGELVKLRKEIKHQCPAGRDDHRSARLLREIHSRHQDTGKITTHGWCLDRDLHGSRYHPTSHLEVIEE